MIEIKKLTKTFGSLVAVDHLDLFIGAGDIFGFIGPNGAGKTTTMRILVTLLEPTYGAAFIDGLDVGKKGKEVRRRVGYMPDFMGVYDDLKVFEYLEFFAAAYKIPSRKRPAIIDGVLELTDLMSKRAALVCVVFEKAPLPVDVKDRSYAVNHVQVARQLVLPKRVK